MEIQNLKEAEEMCVCFIWTFQKIQVMISKYF